MNEIAVYPHKTCIFALEKSCLTTLLSRLEIIGPEKAWI